jgi:D-amino peptidase
VKKSYKAETDIRSKVIVVKAFVSVDLEGMPYVVIPGHLTLKGVQYEEARKIATKITLTVAKELHKAGFNEIIIADSHGPMVNLKVDDLPDYVELIRGFPRPLAMVTGIEGCDVALFLGYHAKSGTAYSTFDHTYSGGSIQSLRINGIEVSEFLLNAYAAGEVKVPVILVAGDYQLLEDDVKEYAPWTERVVLKRSFGRSAARSSGMGKIEKELQEGVKQAISRFKDKKTKLIVANSPLKIEVTFKSTYFADAAELLPQVTRRSGHDVEYITKSLNEAYEIFQLLCLAAAGVNAIKREQ